MFVGNLSFQTTESDVRSAFEQYGTVESVAIITDRDTGRSKGFGFVEMSEEDANKAIAGFSGSMALISSPMTTGLKPSTWRNSSCQLRSERMRFSISARPSVLW